MASEKTRGTRDEADKLRKLGFEFRAPVDEYSYQPDSGSTIGGIRGRQEYGIAGGISSDSSAERNPASLLDGITSDTVDVESTGLSQFSGQSVRPLDDMDPGEELGWVEPGDLHGMIKTYLETHDAIDASAITVDIDEQGEVTLYGEVPSDAMKLRVEEVLSAIPGVNAIDNCLTVDMRRR